MKTENINQLNSLSHENLKLIWFKYFNSKPPMHRSALIRPIAYKLQEKIHGKLKQKYITKLNRYAKEFDNHQIKKRSQKYIIKDETRLSREYKGKVYSVFVKNGKFIYEEEVYSSLSAVAKTITGKSWNGYVFFGIQKSKGKMNE